MNVGSNDDDSNTAAVSADTNAGSDADADSDSDIDDSSECDLDVTSNCGGNKETESDAEFDDDTETAAESIDEAGIWEWVDNPAGEDCGAGCTRCTFTQYGVREAHWDVWDNLLVYTCTFCAIHVIDLENKRTLRIPDPYSEYPNLEQKGSPSSGYHPTIYEKSVYYELALYDAFPRRVEIIHADLETMRQEVVWRGHIPSDMNGGCYGPSELDAYGEHVVSRGGKHVDNDCTLSFYPRPWPTKDIDIINGEYGAKNSIWGDLIAFVDYREPPYDITVYNLSEAEFISVTADDEHQMYPRVQDDRVVYMDFRLGEGEPLWSWEHVAVYMNDVATGETKLITDGASIAAHPDIFGDIVVWLDYRGNDDPHDKYNVRDAEVYGYNLLTEQEFQITDHPGRSKYTPRIWGDKVYIHMEREDSVTAHDIYQFELPE
ncbi:MAG: hypothetical protein GY847_21860 [Proteobacteria bacterium]|nr:hypothetical protein [Pseudomonadota bacterium]